MKMLPKAVLSFYMNEWQRFNVVFRARLWYNDRVKLEPEPGYPQMGQNNGVFARVWNQGYAGVYGAIVNFYWVGPDTGMRRDQDNLIGSEFIDVPAGSCVEVCCPAPWQPNVIDKDHSHECLVVEAYDPILDPLLFPGDEFHASEDRHVGQKAWWVPTILPPWGWVTG
jgi:hypothetical protein